MLENALIGAGILQGLLVLLLYWRLGQLRLPHAEKNPEIIAKTALDTTQWPEHMRATSNAVNNQFQLPVLFYASLACSIYLGVDLIMVVLAFLFVITRYAHAYIYITDNNVRLRFSAFAIGYLLILATWLWLAIRLALRIGGA